ncbi:hypothetical protein PILCRDRAFT_822158 [Piloderma croceum F 1598]|uniref:Uncharacterized protein n=1 Tax=Piloderma croceum (strain F 1598) TaxID=765440 RepID=A0A0C3BU54_PILCF|nr:hypothetical protein PILCRDRAFT_822158 [Piloderma croceum F 1598]
MPHKNRQPMFCIWHSSLYRELRHLPDLGPERLEGVLGNAGILSKRRIYGFHRKGCLCFAPGVR